MTSTSPTSLANYLATEEAQSVLCNFFCKTGRVFNRYDEQKYKNHFLQPDILQTVSEFISQPSKTILFVSITLTEQFQLNITTQIQQLQVGNHQILLFFKRSQIEIQTSRQILSQNLKQGIGILNLGKINTGIELLQAFQSTVSNACLPFLQTTDYNFIKKTTNIETSLGQQLQSSMIPQIEFNYDAKIIQAVAIANSQNREPIGEDLQSFLDVNTEKDFITILSEQMNKWAQQGEMLSNFGMDKKVEHVNNEIGYWQAISNRLEEVLKNFQSPEIKLMQSYLQLKRKSSSLSVDSMKALHGKASEIEKIARIMKELNIEKMLLANDHREMYTEMTQLFSGVPKLVEILSYPANRLKQLIECLTKCVMNKSADLVRKLKPLTSEFDRVKEALGSIKTLIIQKCEVQVEGLKEDLRFKRKTEIVGGFNIKELKKPLQNRIEGIIELRTQQIALRDVLKHIIAKEESLTKKFYDMGFPRIDEFDREFDALANFDPLDLTPNGEQQFNKLVKDFETLAKNIDIRIVECIRKSFGLTKTSSEKFRIFDKSTKALERQYIKNELKNEQEYLLNEISKEQLEYFEKYKTMINEQNSGSLLAKRLRVPPLSFLLLRAEQLLMGLRSISEKLKIVLGESWAVHSKSRELTTSSETLFGIIKQSMDSVVEKIKSEYEQKPLEKAIYIKQEVGGDKLELKTGLTTNNLQATKSMQYLFIIGHEISQRFLIWFFFRRSRWPAYIAYTSLSQAINDFNSLYPTLSELEISLLSKQLKDVYKRIEEGSKMPVIREEEQDVDDNIIEKYSSHLECEVFSLLKASQKIREIIRLNSLQIDNLKMLSIDQQLDSDSISEKYQHSILKIQENINALHQLGVKNLRIYIGNLNSEIESQITISLNNTSQRLLESLDFEPNQTGKSKNCIQLEKINLSVRVDSVSIFLEPTLSHVKFQWFDSIKNHLAWPTKLQKIRIISDDSQYFSLNIYQTSEDKNSLQTLYKKIEEKLSEIDEYFKRWKKLAALWEMDINNVILNYQNDLQSLIQILKEGKQVFESKDNEIYFGKISLNFRLAKRRVSNKFEVIIREILGKIGDIVIKDVTETKNELNNFRELIEEIDFSDIDNIINAIEQLQKVENGMPMLESKVNDFKMKEDILAFNRYAFPSKWCSISILQSQIERIKTIMVSKRAIFDSQKEIIRARILKTEQHERKVIQEIQDVWKTRKPYGGQIHPKNALELLDSLNSQISTHLPSFNKLNKVKGLLKMPLIDLTILNAITEDILSLRELYKLLQDIWKKLDDLLDQPVRLVQSQHLSNAVDNLLEQLSNLPRKYQSFESYIAKKNELGLLKKTSMFLIELKSEAVQEHHWEQILQKIKLGKKFRSLTVGDLHRHNIYSFDKLLGDILAKAQGELVLKKILDKITSFWSQESFQLIQYRDRCILIKGWEEIQEKVDDDLQSMSSMKLSIHFQIFEEEIKGWINKLTEVQSILSIWAFAQRKWVYLEGIFYGSAEIANQLPGEFSRFRSVDSDFMALMKKISQGGKIMEFCNDTPNLKKSLELVGETLEKIQKALSEFLEKQRIAFARFYFVGDSDLLEIIGGGREVGPFQRHLSKMFAGISFLDSINERKTIVGFRSREGESLKLQSNIDILVNAGVDKWLAQLEKSMSSNLEFQTIQAIETWTKEDQNYQGKIEQLLSKHPGQCIILSFQIFWTFAMEECKCKKVLEQIIQILIVIADMIGQNIDRLSRAKIEQLITELVHKRDLTKRLIDLDKNLLQNFNWVSQLRFYSCIKDQNNTVQNKNSESIIIQQCNGIYNYGYEYQGLQTLLVQTPLTDRCFLTLTQALWMRMGGNPFGPAGTGKTESVKALGHVLGRFVLVFNCDETFNFSAMGRIFIGLCQVGAWGCFDEFNRLEERILSAVSQQVLAIQTSLRLNEKNVELLGKEICLSQKVGIFITMNPGYAGRSNLPENLKQLFRQMAMVKPDKELITQVTLFSQGFKNAPVLAGKVVILFELCESQLSQQPHYDFGLRALKGVLTSAGSIKIKNNFIDEEKIVLTAFRDSISPKLVGNDAFLLPGIIKGVFPSSNSNEASEAELIQFLNQECQERDLIATDSFINKLIQLYQVLKLQLGVMLVGKTGSGKSIAWKTLLSAISKKEKSKSEVTVIEPKAFGKEELYGKLDQTTMEWTDGIFTSSLRKICENVKDDCNRRDWIIFDGDVDPEWAENLNSVLDDNRLLTLPNGERISIPKSVSLIFEVENLKYATLATVSRCGMVWFSDQVITPVEISLHFIRQLNATIPSFLPQKQIIQEKNILPSKTFSQVFEKVIELITPMFVIKNSNEYIKGPILKCLEFSKNLPHVMEFSEIRMLQAFFGLFYNSMLSLCNSLYNTPDISINDLLVKQYIEHSGVYSCMWSFSGDLKLQLRSDFYSETYALFSKTIQNLPQPKPETTLIDYFVGFQSDKMINWKTEVPNVEVSEQQLSSAETVIATVDTLRHQKVLCAWMSSGQPFIICGPPGSGKTMTLISTLKAMPDYDMIFVNFSATTSPDLLIKQFEHYGEYIKTGSTMTLRPKNRNKKIVLFCDEINLPDIDKYGTQAVISFLRQLIEQGGYWRPHDRMWINLDRITFVGACNPPTDPGRHPLSNRFLRHCPLILVDFPGKESLLTIYGTFIKTMLQPYPELRNIHQIVTEAMISVYSECQNHYTSDMQAHYIFSPRELTRWKYGIHEALKAVQNIEQLIKLWAHEGLRIFADRMVEDEEREWCEQLIYKIANKYFSGYMNSQTLSQPLLFSSYLSKDYTSVSLNDLREYVRAKMITFSEENTTVQLVLFDSVIEHIARIDRVLRQPIGHCLLVGEAGVGKTTLAKYVAWMNGQSIFQIKPGRNYGLTEFDQNLREVMKRAGCKNEKVCFIFDESNILSVSFMERMNALLAGGEIPGLFDGEELTNLFSNWKEHNQNKRHLSEEEVYAQFVKSVQRNLHVVFTMNPASADFSNRAASSPAIFNRCVVDWFGDWSTEALLQVAREKLNRIEISENCKEASCEFDPKDLLITIFVKIQEKMKELTNMLRQQDKKSTYITPRDYLELIYHFTIVFNEKQAFLIDQERHLRSGLEKLAETENQVKELDQSLAKRSEQLIVGEQEANNKMELIINETKKAEERGQELSQLLEQVSTRKSKIEERSIIVNSELAKVAPALEAAQKSLSLVSKKELDEIRILNNPPELIKLTLTAVCLLTESKELEWKEIQGIMKRPDFLSKVLGLQMDKVNEDAKHRVEKKYVDTPKWNIQKITNSYKSAGMLAEWLTSQLEYGKVISKIQPLQTEINSLEQELDQLEQKKASLSDGLTQIKNSIETYKSDYSSLIGKVQQIKKDISQVNEKVGKSKILLKNLSSEKLRWESGTSGFSTQLDSLPGDALRSAVFLAFSGFFDHTQRSYIDKLIQKIISDAGLKMKQDLVLSEYLSSPAIKKEWVGAGVPNDELCQQNTVILSRFNRFPLIIDPTGQALTFIKKILDSKKVEICPYPEQTFTKVLERCLRFGLPLLALNAEKLEPLMNNVLNKEISRVAGRKLVRVGDQEIDYNPAFNLYLYTRDSDAKFSPDICSRITFVNFTITKSSLEDQCLHQILIQERPDIENDRTNLLKLQGEYVIKLRDLEDQLLQKISQQHGSILEDDALLSTLQTLKTSADQITEESKKSSQTLIRVEQATNKFRSIASKASSIYFLLLSLSKISQFYQFSFQFFQKIFSKAFENTEISKRLENGSDEKIKYIEEQLFLKLLEFLNPVIFQSDRKAIQILIAKIKSEGQELEYLKLITADSNKFNDLKTETQKNHLEYSQSLDQNCLPILKSIDTQTINEIMGKECLKSAISLILNHKFTMEHISNVMSKILVSSNEVNLSLENLYKQISDSGTPFFVYCAPGFDPILQIEKLAQNEKKKLDSVAIGSAEGFATAERLFDKYSRNGGWLILKNVHLSFDWLIKLIEKMNLQKCNNDFRLFLLAEFNDKLPLQIIRNSTKIIFELADGIKGSVIRQLESIQQIDKVKSLPHRFTFQLVWLHCTIIERLKYCPIGWSKRYEFSEADLRASIEIASHILKEKSLNESLESIRALICNNIYGGKIDNEFDQNILQSLIDQNLNIEIISGQLPLIELNGKDLLKRIEGETIADIITNLNSLQIQETPNLVSLPLNSLDLLTTKVNMHFKENIHKLTMSLQDNDTLGHTKQNLNPLAWIEDFKLSINTLDQKFSSFSKLNYKFDLSSPISIFLSREVDELNNILNSVKNDIQLFREMFDLKKNKINKEITNIAKDIVKGKTPKCWRVNIFKDENLTKWLGRIEKSILQVSKLIALKGTVQNFEVDLSLTLYPESAFTATRQQAALAYGQPIDNLELSIKNEENNRPIEFSLLNLFIEGATLQNGQLKTLNEEKNCQQIQSLKLYWTIKSTKTKAKDISNVLDIPLYKDQKRIKMLKKIPLNVDLSTSTKNKFYQHGCALICEINHDLLN